MSTREYSVRSAADLGRVVREVRHSQDLTQSEAVEQFALAFDRTRLARIEAGLGMQSLNRVLSLLRRMGVEVVARVELPEVAE